MPTHKYQKAQIEDFQKQATVEVNSSQDWVTITDKEDPENSVFMQGHEAAEFIEKAKAFYEKNGDISMDEAYSFFAYDYLILLADA